ncbi:glycosyltransferase [Luteipulveratus halotolerans]|uniref:Glycosyl transferase n=1 Tax=Luteipulveratus halotolerans TaxID=1631356 RepID=A0A0L6CMD8_9MICO|nr:glycosyltransferase [Luteipulveratus halotolerans]KNX38703.1 glycosyl transferase [Luteipulveratus halotolerans]
MRVLMWHVHGSWTTSFVRGQHEVLLPVVPDRGPQGRGRARTWTWPERAREVAPEHLRDADIDVVVLQRPEEVRWCEEWTGRRPGRDLPAVYVEHNTPPDPVGTPHPVGADPDLDGIPIVHVTAFNAMAWDNGSAMNLTIEHGVPDPEIPYAGTDPSLAAVVNEPVRRWHVAGTDLLIGLARYIPTHVYGMGMEALAHRARQAGTPCLAGRLHEDVPQERMHQQLARHRAYFHPYRWTSLGLSLIEAMLLGMPVLALATTEAPVAVPAGGGLVSNDPVRLLARARYWMEEPDAARTAGACAREHALDHYALPRFLAEWDALLKEVTR